MPEFNLFINITINRSRSGKLVNNEPSHAPQQQWQQRQKWSSNQRVRVCILCKRDRGEEKKGDKESLNENNVARNDWKMPTNRRAKDQFKILPHTKMVLDNNGWAWGGMLILITVQSLRFIYYYSDYYYDYDY